MNQTRFIIAASLCLASVTAAYAGSDANASATLVGDGFSDRTIQIDSQTQWVNVQRLQTVHFVVAGGQQKAFTVRFDGMPSRPFDLGEVAPAGALAQPVTVYVARSRISR